MKSIRQQCGVSIGGFIQVLVIFVLLAVSAMKLIPAYMENAKVQKAFESIVRDPAMQTATVREIKNSFQNRALTMDSVTVITLDDVIVSNDGGKLSLSASYSKTVPLAGNVSLLLEFNPSASR